MKNVITKLVIIGLIFGFVACSHTTSVPEKMAVSTDPPKIESPVHDSIKFAFYNVENLFDTIDDPKINDNEFLPQNKNQWTTEKYETKLRHISQVFEEMQWPAVIGLSEIENLGVLKDLITKTRMAGHNYGIVHYDSPDERGIDVALLYRKELISIKSSDVITQNFPEDLNDKTRDILHCEVVLPNKNTIHTFVNHWPSRSGGREKTQLKRELVAESLKNAITKVLSKVPNANILAMGDLNDDPNDISIHDKLGALKYSMGESLNANSLINLAAAIKENGEGTLIFDNKWNLFDQIIVNGNLLNNKSTHTDNAQTIGKYDFLLYTTKAGKTILSRTYSGTKYYGGYSDHLPVYVYLHYLNKKI